MYNEIELDKNNWRDIEGYEGRYQINPFGEIYSVPRDVINSRGRLYHVGGKFLHACDGPENYQTVTLSKDGGYDCFSVHRLVASAFLPNPDNLPQVNHIDGDKRNNCVTNLEWCTARHNNEHAWKTKLNRNFPREIKATNIETGEVTIYHSMLEFTEKTGSSSISGSLDNGTNCETKIGTFKVEFNDPELAEKYRKINSTKQPIGGNTPMPVRCLNTGEEFPSMRKCSQRLNIDEELLRHAMRYSDGYVKKIGLQFEFI